ncbi:MAG: hypothetical protein ABL940_04165 [Bacteroidia bacterium]
MAGVLCVFLALQACKKTVIEGPAGKDGASGTNGTNGSNGTNGTNGVTTYNFTVTEVDTNEYRDPNVVTLAVNASRTDFNIPTLTQEVIDKGSIIVTGKRIIEQGYLGVQGSKDSTSWYSLPFASEITDGTDAFYSSYDYSIKKGVLTLRTKLRFNTAPYNKKRFIPVHIKVTTIN